MRYLAAALGLAITLSLAACGGGESDDTGAHGAPVSPAAAKPAAPANLTWGQPAEVTGYNMTKIRVTPQAVLYHRGPYTSGLEGPENGWYAIISVKAEPLSKPDSTAGGAGGGGFQWRGSGQTLAETDGNTSSTPWVGSAPEFGVDAPIEPGDPREGILTFDIPSKTGGRLVYLSPEDMTITASWDIPAADQGTTPGIVKVRKRIKLFS
jgi:hypothetical protein